MTQHLDSTPDPAGTRPARSHRSRSFPRRSRRVPRDSLHTASTGPFTDLATHPLLSAGEEATLLAQATQGDRMARDILVRCNMRLVMSIAARYDAWSLDEQDLVQEGVVGLIHAIDKWNPQRQTRLSTYAVWWIRQAIGRALVNTDRLVRVPVHAENAASRIAKARSTFEAQRGRTPSLHELADAVDMHVDTLRGLLLAQARPLSLSDQAGDVDGVALIDTLCADTDIALEVEAREQAASIRAALGQLDERSRYILLRRYGLDGQPPATLQVLAEQLDVCRERIRQIETQALAVMRVELAGLAPSLCSLKSVLATPAFRAQTTPNTGRVE